MQGRSRLNFSEWGSGSQRGAGEIVGIIEEGEMPPAIYLPLHPAAQLTAAEKQQLITGLTNSLKENSKPEQRPPAIYPAGGLSLPTCRSGFFSQYVLKRIHRVAN
jgi:hypothetical protein